MHSFVSLLSDSGVALEPAVRWPRCLAGRYRMGSRLVPPMEVPRRGPERSSTSWLSWANVVEVQVDLEGGIHRKTAPCTGGC